MDGVCGSDKHLAAELSKEYRKGQDATRSRGREVGRWVANMYLITGGIQVYPQKAKSYPQGVKTPEPPLL